MPYTRSPEYSTSPYMSPTHTHTHTHTTTVFISTSINTVHEYTHTHTRTSPDWINRIMIINKEEIKFNSGMAAKLII